MNFQYIVSLLSIILTTFGIYITPKLYSSSQSAIIHLCLSKHTDKHRFILGCVVHNLHFLSHFLFWLSISPSLVQLESLPDHCVFLRDIYYPNYYKVLIELPSVPSELQCFVRGSQVELLKSVISRNCNAVPRFHYEDWKSKHNSMSLSLSV